MQRCTNPNSPVWKHYGGRGIKVHPSWRSYQQFREDMGVRPLGTTLEREDNDGDYEPSNCRWATKLEQARNRRSNVNVTIGGRTQCLKDWCREYGIHPNTVSNRVKRRGVTYEQALTQPVR